MFTFAFIFTLSLLMLFLAVKILKQDFTSFNPFTFQPVEDLYDKVVRRKLLENGWNGTLAAYDWIGWFVR